MARSRLVVNLETGESEAVQFTAEEEAAANVEEAAATEAANDPANFPLSMRQLRQGLRKYASKPASFIQGVIDDNITDPALKDDAQIWYEETSIVHWEHDLTQLLISLSGIPADDARSLWVQTAKNIPA